MSSVSPAITPNNTEPVSYICYVNGIAVPVVNITIETTVNQIPTAQVTFFPSQALIRLGAEDRVSVTVFYLDLHYADPTYRLIFDGEIVGWSYSSSGDSRSMTATAVADIAIFQQVQYSFLNTEDAMARRAVNSGSGSDNVARTGVQFPYSLFQDGLLYEGDAEGKKVPDPSIKRPFDILYNAVRGMSDINIPTKDRSLPVINFFARWCRLRQFNQRFVAYPDFDDGDTKDSTGVFPIINAAKSYFVIKELQDLAAGWATDGSMYDVLTNVFQSVYYEIATLMTPPAVRVRLSDGVILGLGSAGTTATEPLRIASYYAKPQMLFATPPVFNVLFPSMVRNLQYAENYRTQPTRVYMLDGYLSSLQDPGLAADVLTWAYPPQAKAAMQSRYPDTSSGTNPVKVDPHTTGKNHLIWPEEFFKGPVTYRGEIPAIYAALIHNLEAAQNAKKPDDDHKKTTVNPQTATLLSLYAEYEYFRVRYSERGGAADLVFNPYVVPGYPTVILEKMSGMSQVAYIHTVLHNLSNSGMSTSVNYSSGRTINEWCALVESESRRLGRVLSSAPAEPVEAVRQTLQNDKSAGEHYKKVFWGREDPKKSTTFKPQDALEAVSGSKLTATGPGEDAYPLGSKSAPAAGETVQVNLQSSARLRLTHDYQTMAEDTTAALKFASRPICSLRDYVLFINEAHNEQSLPDSIKKHKQMRGKAVYYSRIKINRYRNDPAQEGQTGSKLKHVAGERLEVATPVTRATAYTGSEVRANWEAVLLDYIAEIDGDAPSE